MPTKREFLEQLKRAELVAAVDRFELSVGDRRVRDQLIEALAPSQTPLEGILGVLTKDRMREISKALGIDERVKEESTAFERRPSSERPSEAARSAPPAGPDTAPPRSDTAPPRQDYYSRPARPRSAPGRGGGYKPSPGRFSPRSDRPSFERRPRPSGPSRGKPINIQDGYLFESLKENRLLQFALVTGQQIKGRIRRFDQFTVLVDTGTRDVLIYKSALSDIAAG